MTVSSFIHLVIPFLASKIPALQTRVEAPMGPPFLLHHFQPPLHFGGDSFVSSKIQGGLVLRVPLCAPRYELADDRKYHLSAMQSLIGEPFSHGAANKTRALEKGFIDNDGKLLAWGVMFKYII